LPIAGMHGMSNANRSVRRTASRFPDRRFDDNRIET
jgi:hypothetical protein